jgi:uncharacterized protein YjgD (DUF1641 family)
MAKAIAIVPTPKDSPQGIKDELLRRLDAAPLEHAEAMLKLYDLLEVANERHVLDIAKGALASTDGIVTRVAHELNKQSSINAIRNGMMMVEMLGSLDPEVLHHVVKALPAALASGTASATSSKPPSLWKSLRGFLSAEGRRTLGFASALTVALGAALGKKK